MAKLIETLSTENILTESDPHANIDSVNQVWFHTNKKALPGNKKNIIYNKYYTQL